MYPKKRDKEIVLRIFLTACGVDPNNSTSNARKGYLRMCPHPVATMGSRSPCQDKSRPRSHRSPHKPELLPSLHPTHYGGGPNVCSCSTLTRASVGCTGGQTDYHCGPTNNSAPHALRRMSECLLLQYAYSGFSRMYRWTN
ncbi:hypothetical protein J6590_001842 [Homalodisca vitripennis]|nr:hypothetical protein J6590_001842 [Homalodisca vitripennis]